MYKVIHSVIMKVITVYRIYLVKCRSYCYPCFKFDTATIKGWPLIEGGIYCTEAPEVSVHEQNIRNGSNIYSRATFTTMVVVFVSATNQGRLLFMVWHLTK